MNLDSNVVATLLAAPLLDMLFERFSVDGICLVDVFVYMSEAHSSGSCSVVEVADRLLKVDVCECVSAPNTQEILQGTHRKLV